jgi:hypothetical protein
MPTKYPCDMDKGCATMTKLQLIIATTLRDFIMDSSRNHWLIYNNSK